MTHGLDRRTLLKVGAASTILSPLASPAFAQGKVEISFFFPVSVGGPVTKIIDGFAEAFGKENPNIVVKPVYSGTYVETTTKAITAHKSGQPPALSVIGATDIFTLIDEEAIVPFDDFVKTTDDKAWIADFFPGFMENSQTEGKTWGIPFQRSTIVMYWNKELFKEAGLDPEKPPQNWAELVEFSKKLTKKDASGAVTQWGVQIPSSGFPKWLFQAITTQNGAILMNAEGDKTDLASPAVVESAQYWLDLSAKHGVQPPGIVEWGTTPKDFFEKKVAIMWTTTGNLTNVRTNAKFPFGVAMLPEGKRRGTPTGGANFYIFKKAPKAEQEAAFKFIQWVTSPERAAQWSIDTGYVATRTKAWETEAMKKYVAEFPPAAVARDQLKYAVAEFSTHENQRVGKVLDDALQAILTGKKPAADALKEAQAEADRILKPYRK